jgi:hypothetical protein
MLPAQSQAQTRPCRPRNRATYVNQADREREIENDLRRRQILTPPDRSPAPIVRASTSIPSQQRTPIRARAAGR